MVALIVIVLIVAAVFMFAVGVYNGLVAKRERYKNAYAQIDVQLKRRYDLIPNLVETAKGYLAHEKDTLEAVIRARNTAMAAAQAAAAKPGDPSVMKGLAQAEGALGASLVNLNAVSERYPDIKGNQIMNDLFEELSATENKVAFSRQAYNDTVTDYNTARLHFPAVIFAAGMGFGEAALLEATESPEERKAPKVSFGSASPS